MSDPPMLGGHQYYTLIGSLPALPSHFEQAEHLPISSRQLTERLKMLEPSDAETVKRLGDFLVWERQPLEQTDDQFLNHYERLLHSFQNAFARELVEWAISLRTIIAGLRCRRLGLEPPVVNTPIGMQVQRNFAHPNFRLAGQYPWIEAIAQQLAGPSPYEVERMRLGVAWSHATRLNETHFFDFEALLLYLIRWEIVLRWTQRDAERGRQLFEQLVESTLGPYAHMFNQQS